MGDYIIMNEEMVNYYTIISGKLASVRDNKLIPTVQSTDGGMIVLDKLIKHVKEQDRKYADLVGELLIKNKRLEEALTRQAPSKITDAPKSLEL